MHSTPLALSETGREARMSSAVLAGSAVASPRAGAGKERMQSMLTCTTSLRSATAVVVLRLLGALTVDNPVYLKYHGCWVLIR